MNACLEFRNFCLLEFVLCLACWRLAVFMSACRDSSSGFHQDFAEFGCFKVQDQMCIVEVGVLLLQSRCCQCFEGPVDSIWKAEIGVVCSSIFLR